MAAAHNTACEWAWDTTDETIFRSINIGLQDMAIVAGLGQYHFSTMFRQSMGISPYRYVIDRRIDRAISDISLSCGFADQSHLTKHFRRLVGMTPKTFREH
ncbi:MAG: hypothetical protein RLZZ135_1042 [Cyanobacteriota bacterium]